VVVDIVLPAVLGLVLVGEASIEAWRTPGSVSALRLLEKSVASEEQDASGAHGRAEAGGGVPAGRAEVSDQRPGSCRRGGSLPVTNLKGLVTSSSPFSLSDMIAIGGGARGDVAATAGVGVVTEVKRLVRWCGWRAPNCAWSTHNSLGDFRACPLGDRRPRPSCVSSS